MGDPPLAGRSLLRWPPWTLPLAIGVSVVEIAIIVTKFVLFLSAPEWTIWRANWFINKIFVLACFGLMLGWLARRGVQPQLLSREEAPG